MSPSGDSMHTPPFLTTIGEDAVNEIKQAAFLILEQTGCTVDHPEALEQLRRSGARVEGTRVYLPRHLIQTALDQVPKGFIMYDRNGLPAMDLTERKSYFGTSTASPNQRHALDHDRRETTLRDIALGATVADALSKKPFICAYPEPISPLQFPKDTVEKIAACATQNIPQVISGSQFRSRFKHGPPGSCRGQCHP